MTKNITVSVDPEVYRLARVRAAERGTSVSALVTEYLRSLSIDQDAEFARLRSLQLQVATDLAETGTEFSASERLSRDDIHQRNPGAASLSAL